MHDARKDDMNPFDAPESPLHGPTVGQPRRPQFTTTEGLVIISVFVVLLVLLHPFSRYARSVAAARAAAQRAARLHREAMPPKAAPGRE